jgi:phenylalanyl-tRNA synthetase alpha chain
MRMKKTFTQMAKDLEGALSGTIDRAALEAARVEYLGRKGKLATAMKDMGQLSPGDRKEAGAAANEAKEAMEASFEAAEAPSARTRSGST